jgi:hypothetical protein
MPIVTVDRTWDSEHSHQSYRKKVRERTGENAKRTLPYSPNKPREIKFSYLGEFWNKTKNILDLRSST